MGVFSGSKGESCGFSSIGLKNKAECKSILRKKKRGRGDEKRNNTDKVASNLVRSG